MRLHVNVDHIATIRQARRTDEPDPVRAAVLAELGGADGITVHLREDRRHIQDRDVRLLVETARSGVNFEMASAPDIVALALELSPKAVTLVPERRQEVTTEGGLALGDVESRQRLGDVVEQLASAGLPVSLFIDPDRDAIDTAAALGAHAVELHTGEYANACGRSGSADDRNEQVGRLARAAAHAHACGLATHAGHGLTYENVAPIAAISEIEELNIGHSIVSRAVLTGMESAVREMKRILRAARQGGEAA